MIIEFLLNIVVNMLCTLINGLHVVTLPVDLIAVLAKVTAYGNAIVGTDLMVIVAGSILFWTTARISLGIIVFIWKLLPFT